MKIHKPKRSLVIEAVIGISAGENHQNEKEFSDEELAEYVKMWDDICLKQECGMSVPYYPATITPVRAVYKKDWGCPTGGEKCILVSVGINPVFTNLNCTSTFQEMLDSASLGFGGGFLCTGERSVAENKVFNEVANILIIFARMLGNNAVTIHHRFVDVLYAEEIQDMVNDERVD